MRILRRGSHTTMDSCKMRRGSYTTIDDEGLLQDDEGLLQDKERLPTLYTMNKKGLSHGYN